MASKCGSGGYFEAAGAVVGLGPGGHKAGDPAADDALAHVNLDVLVAERLGGLGAGGAPAHAALEPRDDQHERDERR